MTVITYLGITLGVLLLVYIVAVLECRRPLEHAMKANTYYRWETAKLIAKDRQSLRFAERL